MPYTGTSECLHAHLCMNREREERERKRERDMIGKQYFVCVQMILESEMN